MVNDSKNAMEQIVVSSDGRMLAQEENLISACFRSPDRRGTFRGHQSRMFRVKTRLSLFSPRLKPRNLPRPPHQPRFLLEPYQLSSEFRLPVALCVRRTFGYFMNAENLLRDNEAHAGSERLTNEKKITFSWVRA